VITEDYKPTREELEAEGLLKMWCDCIESGHYGFAAWLPNECIMRANADKRRQIAAMSKIPTRTAQAMMGRK
jgi:hypothetical protein